MLSRHLSIWVESNLVKRKPWPSFFASFRGWIGKQAICCLFFYCCINNNILLWPLSFQYRWYERKTPLAPGPDFLRLSTWSILLKILMGVKGPLTPDPWILLTQKIIHKYEYAPVDDIEERERSIYSCLHILHGPPNTSPIALYIGWSWKGQKVDLYKCCCSLVVKIENVEEIYVQCWSSNEMSCKLWILSELSVLGIGFQLDWKTCWAVCFASASVSAKYIDIHWVAYEDDCMQMHPLDKYKMKCL